jgi:hypothetical protein
MKGDSFMRALSIASAAAAILTTTLLVAGPASADRVCRQVCDGGFCKSRCVERGPRLYNMEPRDHMRRPGVELYNRDHFRRPGMEHHRPGVEVEINR